MIGYDHVLKPRQMIIAIGSRDYSNAPSWVTAHPPLFILGLWLYLNNKHCNSWQERGIKMLCCPRSGIRVARSIYFYFVCILQSFSSRGVQVLGLLSYTAHRIRRGLLQVGHIASLPEEYYDAFLFRPKSDRPRFGNVYETSECTKAIAWLISLRVCENKPGPTAIS